MPVRPKRRAVGAAVALVAGALACASPALAAQTHRWTGDGTTADSIGGAHGTWSGGEAYVAGAVGQGFRFDGVDDLVDFGTTAGNFGTGDFSISFWLRADSSDADGEGVLGKRPVCNHGSMWDVRLSNAGVGSLFSELDGSAGALNYNTLNTGGTIRDGEFHHYALVRSGATATAYLDGLEKESETTGGVTNLVNSAALIAGRSTCTAVDGTDWFTGVLDDIRFLDEADPTAFDFAGFGAPVNSGALNTVQAGRAIPVRFSLGGDQGLDVFVNGYPKSHSEDCDSGLGLDGIESTVTAGGSSLSYDAVSDTYSYVWKTDKAWAGSCRELVLRFADGSTQTANFQLR